MKIDWSIVTLGIVLTAIADISYTEGRFYAILIPVVIARVIQNYYSQG